MTLNFSSWILCPSGPTSIGYQYDNLTDVLQVTGTVPAGWSWDLMVQCGTNLNIIPMEQAEDGSLSVTLTAEMIPLTGYYTMQLRATQGELVKYTNQFRAYVGASLSGDAQWPTVPTEFTELEQNLLSLNAHPPMSGPNGYWMIWDVTKGKYVESTVLLPGNGKKLDAIVRIIDINGNCPDGLNYDEELGPGKWKIQFDVSDSGDVYLRKDITLLLQDYEAYPNIQVKYIEITPPNGERIIWGMGGRTGFLFISYRKHTSAVSHTEELIEFQNGYFSACKITFCNGWWGKIENS